MPVCSSLSAAVPASAASRPTSPAPTVKRAAEKHQHPATADDAGFLAFRPLSHQPAALTAWLPSAGVSVNGDAITLSASAGGALAVHVAQRATPWASTYR